MLVLRVSVYALLVSISLTPTLAQTNKEQPTAACPDKPNTVRAMRGCYRPLLVFAPSLDDPQLVNQLNRLKGHATELKSRNVLYVPLVPEGHNQPVPASGIPTARLSEDELAAARLRFQVEPQEFLVVLIGKDGGEKLTSRTPVPIEQLEKLIDSMPMRKNEAK